VPIQVLFEPTPQDVSEWQEFDLIASLSSISVIPALAANLTAPIKVHIHVDTGLGRVSLQPEKVGDFYKILSAFDCFKIEGVFSHFSNSYQPAKGRNKEVSMNQLHGFKGALTSLEKSGLDVPLKHMANSGGILQYPESYFDMVRPGNLIYGYRPNYSRIPLTAALSWKTQIRSLVKAPKEVGMGYNQAYVPATDTTIALIDIGFADGFPPGLSGSGHVLVRGVKAPIVGTMGMDQTMIDVGHIPDLSLCEEVVLVGRQENLEISAVELGDNLSVNPSSISCGISRRTSTIYKNAIQL
jgi:alanine racemase